MTRKLYLYADAPLQGEARIVRIDNSGDRPAVRLQQTWFHVKGGGQLADRGMIGPARVVDVRHAEQGEVDHFVESLDELEVGELVVINVDADHRKVNTKLHTAGHLVAGVMAKPFPLVLPTGAHHYPGECRVEFKGPAETLDRLRGELPMLLDEAIARDLTVEVLGDPEVNRSIQIGEFPAIHCGGTHLPSLGPLVRIEITNLKVKDSKIRISYSLCDRKEQA